MHINIRTVVLGRLGCNDTTIDGGRRRFNGNFARGFPVRVKHILTRSGSRCGREVISREEHPLNGAVRINRFCTRACEAACGLLVGLCRVVVWDNTSSGERARKFYKVFKKKKQSTERIINTPAFGPRTKYRKYEVRKNSNL